MQGANLPAADTQTLTLPHCPKHAHLLLLEKHTPLLLALHLLLQANQRAFAAASKPTCCHQPLPTLKSHARPVRFCAHSLTKASWSCGESKVTLLGNTRSWSTLDSLQQWQSEAAQQHTFNSRQQCAWYESH